MRKRLILWIVPMLIAASAGLATPAPAMAADGMTENGITTYEVLPSKQSVRVTIQLSIHNNMPSTSTTDYFWNLTQVAVEAQAKSVKVASDAGAVTQRTTQSDKYYRYLELTYPNVYYGQTRTVTVNYSIPAAPHSASSFRAGKAYASLCAVGNGQDTGSISVIVPDVYTVNMVIGQTLPATDDSNGKQTFSTGSMAQPNKFWTCLDAENAAAFSASTVTAGGQSFDIQSWPEDLTWTSQIQSDVSGDVAKLMDLTGFSVPGGIIVIREAGDNQLGDYAGFYNATTKSATIAEDTSPDVVAHELSHIWFNQNLFDARWLDEGFAVLSEQVAGPGKYTKCTDPGAYPGNGSPNLSNWVFLDIASTKQDQAVVDYQYRAACYILARLSSAIGPVRVKQVLAAANDGEIAYLGKSKTEKSPLSGPPISTRTLLDLFDERGMVPAGVGDINLAQNLLERYGILGDTTQLDARSAARTTYHELQTAAKGWALPLAVRSPMAKWEFDTAEAAMASAGEILDLREQIHQDVPGLKLDGTKIQSKFEDASSQADLDALLALTQEEADAASKLAEANSMSKQHRGFLGSIGLVGTDFKPLIDKAATELKAIDPGPAAADATRVTNQIRASSNQGVLRIFLLLGILLLLLLAAVIAVLVIRSRRRPVVGVAPDEGGGGQIVVMPQAAGDLWTSWSAPPPAEIPAHVPPREPPDSTSGT